MSLWIISDFEGSEQYFRLQGLVEDQGLLRLVCADGKESHGSSCAHFQNWTENSHKSR